MNDSLAKSELNLLNSLLVISFKGRHTKEINKIEFNLITINNPSWILQGGSGCLKKEAVKIYLLKYYDDWENIFL